MQKIITLILIICASLLVGILTPKHYISSFFEDLGYYFILVSFILWATYLFKLYFKKIKDIFRNHYQGLLLSVFLLVLIFCMAPPKFKVLSDETNLIGVSMAMYQSKKASLPLKGFNLEYKKPEYNSVIDKRPLLFPLLISFVHSVRGYSAFNGFVVNFIAGVGVLFIFYLFIYTHFSRIYGLLSILMFASLPGFVTWVTSSGFETINLFFIIFTIFLFNKVITTRSIQHTELLFLTLVLVSQCRYESIIFTIAILFLVPMLFNKESIPELSIITFIIPILFIPVIWSPRLYADLPDINRVGTTLIQVPSLYDAFRFTNLIENTRQNLIALLGLDPYLGFSPLISLLAIGGFFLLAKKMIFSYRNTSIEFKTMWFFGVATFCLLYIIQFSFYRGDLTIFTQNRFATVYLPYVLFPAIFFLYSILNKANGIKINLVVLFFVFHLMFFWPFGAQQRFVNVGSLPYEYNKTLMFLKENFKNNSNILIIAERPNIYIIHYRGAVDFSFANQNIDKIKNRYNKEFDHILVLQKIDDKTQTPLEWNEIEGAYRLEKLSDIKLTQSTYLKISEILDE
jgi:hypothetical protein